MSDANPVDDLIEALENYGASESADLVRALADEIDHLRARLVAKDILLSQAIEYGDTYKRERDKLMVNYQATLARLAAVEAECADLIAGKEYQAMQRTLGGVNARLAEAERRLTSAEEWRDYYRAKWLGDRAVPQPEPPTTDSAGDVQK